MLPVRHILQKSITSKKRKVKELVIGGKRMNLNEVIAEELGVKLWQVDAAVKLIDEGNTIPFIARYRKPVTGELNDEQLRALDERLKYLRNLEEKKDESIEESPVPPVGGRGAGYCGGSSDPRCLQDDA